MRNKLWMGILLAVGLAFAMTSGCDCGTVQIMGPDRKQNEPQQQHPDEPTMVDTYEPTTDMDAGSPEVINVELTIIDTQADQPPETQPEPTLNICSPPPVNCPELAPANPCDLSKIVWYCRVPDHEPEFFINAQGWDSKGQRHVLKLSQGSWIYINGKPIAFQSFEILASGEKFTKYNKALSLDETRRLCLPCHPNKYVVFKQTDHRDSTYKDTAEPTKEYAYACWGIGRERLDHLDKKNTWGYHLNQTLYRTECDPQYQAP